MEKTIIELFAGVGGFRLGFDRLNSGWSTKWFSQWEPEKKNQWAHDCYVRHFGPSLDLNGKDTTGIDIAKVDKKFIPDASLLVGGFPCQDYSVAHGLNTEKGIEGKKGVLWWQIFETLQEKKTPFCLFENVDRLLKSPSKQRGRDFGIMLACLNSLGYSVEWRVVNAAEYGAVQRRRRVFIFAYSDKTEHAKYVENVPAENIFHTEGFFAKAFPVESLGKIESTSLCNDIVKVSDAFSFPFENAGYMHNGMIYTTRIVPIEEKGPVLSDILESNVDEKYYESEERLEKWKYLKGSKRIERIASNGHKYMYSEGAMTYPDAWDAPGRTMLTSEGTLNRSSHVVEDPATRRIRILTPVECERMQGFEDGWTEGMPEKMRYFCMGNALVVPMITRMGKVLDNILQ